MSAVITDLGPVFYEAEPCEGNCGAKVTVQDRGPATEIIDGRPARAEPGELGIVLDPVVGPALYDERYGETSTSFGGCNLVFEPHTVARCRALRAERAAAS